MFGIDSATPRLFWLLEGESKRLARPADARDDSVFDLPSIRLASLVGDGAAEFGCEVEGRHSEKREERSRARVLGRAVVVVTLLEGLEALELEGALELVVAFFRTFGGGSTFMGAGLSAFTEEGVEEREVFGVESLSWVTDFCTGLGGEGMMK